MSVSRFSLESNTIIVPIKAATVTLIQV